jgi:hypothetical protein
MCIKNYIYIFKNVIIRQVDGIFSRIFRHVKRIRHQPRVTGHVHLTYMKLWRHSTMDEEQVLQILSNIVL